MDGSGPGQGYAHAFSGPDARLPRQVRQIVGGHGFAARRKRVVGLAASLFRVGAGVILPGCSMSRPRRSERPCSA